ncbi:hypothetical protein AGABI1DRAFT_121934 [Agaricus bisporus var. burnettii JB137-S8]|uniref:Uncharacterized protein n=1 Tax=Agaricus bisporus var. burnettii (strain JB137-S8 / ATCC MYA-4627 / FGSC 10392) TaxID=597362 RepID=K5WQ88_AGABU|nr:uncharacterized protein AGABI1DRAFT_121934 [Agaricus bisporus var. burnettii JB137-S8]EKM77516.1 hypothetical protein AGABI1DRAFT_121934 [Agaricus bisporus var. burnettii JB137-S8]
MEWNSLSEEDQNKQQEEWIKYLNKPDTLEKFGEACKNIGQTAVAIDDDFRTVKKGFTELVTRYGRDFPDVERVFVQRWDALKARWNGESGILWSSRELAARTAAALSDYDLNLRLVQEIACKGDLEDARAELKQYVKTHPIHISKKVADNFKNLKNEIKDFSQDFTNYIEDQKQKLSSEARKYEEDIWRLQNEISKDAAYALGFSWLLGLLAMIPATFLIIHTIQRREVQAKLDRVKADLAEVARKQQALASMQADFAHLKPNIDDICTKLGIFAGIWAFAIEQTIEIDTALEDGMNVITSKKFKLKLDFLRAQIKPLQEGMRQYSTQITAS